MHYIKPCYCYENSYSDIVFIQASFALDSACVYIRLSACLPVQPTGSADYKVGLDKNLISILSRITILNILYNLNQSLHIGNWSLGNKFQGNLNQNTTIFIQENQYENVICKMMAILSMPPCSYFIL